MKRNSVTLTLASLIIGAAITLGLTRASGTTFSTSKACDSTLFCTAKQYGYPMRFLHSNATNHGGGGLVTSWIEFKPATADWLIWSVVSAIGIGLLVALLERAGLATGFVDKKKKSRK